MIKPDEWYHDHSYWEVFKVRLVQDGQVHLYWQTFTIPVPLFEVIYVPGGYEEVMTELLNLRKGLLNKQTFIRMDPTTAGHRREIQEEINRVNWQLDHVYGLYVADRKLNHLS